MGGDLFIIKVLLVAIWIEVTRDRKMVQSWINLLLIAAIWLAFEGMRRVG